MLALVITLAEMTSKCSHPPPRRLSRLLSPLHAIAGSKEQTGRLSTMGRYYKASTTYARAKDSTTFILHTFFCRNVKQKLSSVCPPSLSFPYLCRHLNLAVYLKKKNNRNMAVSKIPLYSLYSALLSVFAIL